MWSLLHPRGSVKQALHAPLRQISLKQGKNSPASGGRYCLDICLLGFRIQAISHESGVLSTPMKIVNWRGHTDSTNIRCQERKGPTCFIAAIVHGLLVVVIICGDVAADKARVAAVVTAAQRRVSVAVAAAFRIYIAGMVSVATVVCEAALI